MTSISKEAALRIMKYGGKYLDDPQIIAIIRYSAFGKFNFKLVYTHYEFRYCMDSFNERNMLPKVIWKLGDEFDRQSILTKIGTIITQKDMEYPYQP